MTGRRRFNCISPKQELAFGIHSYRDILQQYGNRILPADHPYTTMVNRVMQRLIPEAPIKGADWKVHVIHDDKMMNAFVLPGYVGLLRTFCNSGTALIPPWCRRL
jgi:predicted Zn-dependent protease